MREVHFYMLEPVQSWLPEVPETEPCLPVEVSALLFSSSVCDMGGGGTPTLSLQHSHVLGFETSLERAPKERQEPFRICQIKEGSRPPRRHKHFEFFQQATLSFLLWGAIGGKGVDFPQARRKSVKKQYSSRRPLQGMHRDARGNFLLAPLKAWVWR